MLKGAAQFFADTLVEEPVHKWMVTCPSLSPEHVHPGGVSVCAGPSMDTQIVRDLFEHCVRALGWNGGNGARRLCGARRDPALHHGRQALQRHRLSQVVVHPCRQALFSHARL